MPIYPADCQDHRRRSLLAGAAGAAGTALWGGGCAQPPAVAPDVPLPQVPFGRIERLPAFASRHVAPRHVDIWLPPGYAAGQPHAVLYMHDGQMLFDPTHTWNRQCWQLAQAMQALSSGAGAIHPTIVVGIWNSGATRFAEYFPQAMLPHLAAGPVREQVIARGLQPRPLADDYLRFLVEELKPAIDARYATRSGPEHCVIAGSSMGGLISLYALARHPQVFGGAAALSTHWIGVFERNEAVPAAALAWLREALPPPGRHRLYMDRGDRELDAQYDRAQEQVDALLRERGWRAPLWASTVFEGSGHNETDWARRVVPALRHLLGP